MLRKLISILVLFILGSCNSSTEVENKSTLDKIYESNDLVELSEYLNDWESDIQSISENEFYKLSIVEKNVYQIYESFYNPSDLGNYCTTGRCPEFGNNMYSNLDYFIVQNKIQYTLNEYEDRDTLIDFRPRLELDKSILYLTNNYSDELNNFLNRENHGDDIQNRFEFINEKIKIVSGHWFGWHFISHPEVSIVEINKSLDSASVQFRIIYEGGEAKFAKVADEWVMYESMLTWIE